MSKHTTKRGRKKVETDPKWVAFGQRLVTLRQAKGLHAYQVAQLIGVDPATISQLENGRRATGPEQDTLGRLAGLFEVPIDFLLHGHTDAKSRGSDRSPGPDPRDARTSQPVELADIRAAVSDAIFAIVADLFESLAESRKRSAPDLRREAGGLVASATGRAGSH